MLDLLNKIGGIHMAEHSFSNFQGPGVPASAEDLAREKSGYTNPNLHRRVNPATPSTKSSEVKPRKYSFMRSSVYELQSTEIFCHDEDSDTEEIP